MEARQSVADGAAPEAIEFIRFCYRRRPHGWPDLYDEMCRVASRRLFRGWGTGELAERGIGFSLFETPRLAALVETVVRQERTRAGGPVASASDGPAPRLRAEALAAG
jgi:hypothetical protein